MTLNTPLFELPYPQDGDVPDAPTQIHNLALRVEALLDVLATHGIVAASGSSGVLPTTWTDVPGCSIDLTPTMPVHALIVATFYVDIEKNAGASTLGIDCRLTVDSTGQAKAAHVYKDDAIAVATVHQTMIQQVYRVPLTAALHTLKLQAQRVSNGGAVVTLADTQFLYRLVPQE